MRFVQASKQVKKSTFIAIIHMRFVILRSVLKWLPIAFVRVFLALGRNFFLVYFSPLHLHLYNLCVSSLYDLLRFVDIFFDERISPFVPFAALTLCYTHLYLYESISTHQLFHLQRLLSENLPKNFFHFLRAAYFILMHQQVLFWPLLCSPVMHFSLHVCTVPIYMCGWVFLCHEFVQMLTHVTSQRTKVLAPASPPPRPDQWKRILLTYFVFLLAALLFLLFVNQHICRFVVLLIVGSHCHAARRRFLCGTTATANIQKAVAPQRSFKIYLHIFFILLLFHFIPPLFVKLLLCGRVR